MKDKRIKETPKDRALHRIKIIQGHLKKVERMLSSDEYCIDIVHQSLAIQRALRKLDTLVIEKHLKTCVIHQVKTGEEEKTTQELLKLFELS